MLDLRLHSLLLLACTSLFGCFGQLGLPISSCEGVTCGGHGRCLDLGDEVTCQCDAGFSRRDGPTCVASAGDSAKPGDPTAGDPATGDPTAGDPATGDPTAGDPATGDPTAGDPVTGDPTAGDPATAGDYNLANRISEPPTFPSDCGPLPTGAGPVINVTPAQAASLPSIIESAASGTTIYLEDGTYDLSGADSSGAVRFNTDDITVRSVSGDATTVIIDAGYVVSLLFRVQASMVTITDITVQHANDTNIYIGGTGTKYADGYLIYRTRNVDPKLWGVGIRNAGWTDQGVVACSTFELTTAGRTLSSSDPRAITGIGTWGTVIFGNTIRGFRTSSGGGRAIAMSAGARDIRIERNWIEDSFTGIRAGYNEASTGAERVHPDYTCPSGGFVDFYDGVICGNVLFTQVSGMDTGIALWSACGTQVVHNTIYSTNAAQGAMEWRYPGTLIEVHNNVLHTTADVRQGATANLTNNIEGAGASMYVNALGGDFTPASSATLLLDRGTVLSAGTCDTDFTGAARSSPPDIGAYEAP